jgi:hypothetical protein
MVSALKPPTIPLYTPLKSPVGSEHKTTLAPMIYTSLGVMMREDTLLGQVGGGWAQEIESFLGPLKWHRADRRVPYGAPEMYLHLQ